MEKRALERIDAYVREVTEEMEPALADEAREDFTAHLHEATERLIGAGVPEDEAVERAIRDFGTVPELRRRLAAVDRDSERPLSPSRIGFVERLQSAAGDVRLSVRSALRRPLVPAVVVVTTAIGIAATTAVYSVVDKVLLEPLPYPSPDEVVVLANEAGDFGVTSPANFLDIREATRSVFTGFAAYSPTTFVASVGDVVERVDGSFVSGGFFDVLATPPEVGQPIDLRHEAGDESVVVVSHAFWERHLGARPLEDVGSIDVDGVPTRVLGVMPEGFQLHDPVDLWLPLTLLPGEASRGSNYLFTIGRLAPGTSIASAQSVVDVVAARLHAEYPRFFGDGPLPVASLHEASVVGVESRLRLMAVAVLLVLLLVCANVGMLLHARAEERRGEFALRVSMGAPRHRVVRLVTVDTLLFVAPGGVAGTALASTAISFLRSVAPRGLPRADEVAMDPGVLAAALTATVLAGLVVAIPVSWNTIRGGLEGMSRSTGPSRRRARMRRGLVITQLAGSVVLMVSAALLVQSLDRLRSVDPGFVPDGLMTAQVSLNGEEYADTDGRWRYFQALEERLLGEPGVTAVGVGTFRPTSGGFTRRFALSDRPPPPDDAYFFATFDPVAPGYFEALGIPLRAGRSFDDLDGRDARPVTVVNEAFVDEFFPEASPIGVRLGFYVNGEPRPDQLEIVGVVGSVRSDALASDARPAIYLPMSLSPMTSGAVFVRTAHDDPALAERVRAAFLDVDPTQPPYSLRPMSEVFAGSIERDRLLTLLMTLFALSALILACSGVFGLTSYTVSRRTREFGLRIALGAEPGEILRSTLRSGLATVAIGVSIGCLGAYAVSGVLRSALFDIDALDPLTYAGVSLALVAVTLAAVSIPARRASSVHPLEALRHD